MSKICFTELITTYGKLLIHVKRRCISGRYISSTFSTCKKTNERSIPCKCTCHSAGHTLRQLLRSGHTSIYDKEETQQTRFHMCCIAVQTHSAYSCTHNIQMTYVYSWHDNNSAQNVNSLNVKKRDLPPISHHQRGLLFRNGFFNSTNIAMKSFANRGSHKPSEPRNEQKTSNLRALSSREVTVLIVVDYSATITAAIFAPNERIEAKRLRQTYVAVGSGDSRRTHASTSVSVTQTTRAVTFCTSHILAVTLCPL